MRTTVDIPDFTYRQLKTLADAEGKTVIQLLLRGAESVLREEPLNKPARRLRSPILNEGEPGSLKLDNQKIYDLIGFP